MITINANDYHQKVLNSMLSHQDLMSIWTLRIFLKYGIGEMSTIPIGFHGLEINISLNIVDLAGHMEQLHQLLTELTLLETELGQI